MNARRWAGAALVAAAVVGEGVRPAYASLPSAAASAAAGRVRWDPRSWNGAPCGTGVPAPGHLLPEVRAGDRPIVITVRQAADRLCYVVDGVADAPVIHVRQGTTFEVVLDNEIRDPAAIDAIGAPGELKSPNPPVPVEPGLYKVAPGMRHPATGATNLHVHGFTVSPRVPADDVLDVCADPPAGPARCGHNVLTYRYRVEADMPEGLYWYHPHVHGEVQAQMLMGLAGAIVVEGPQDDARRAAGIRDRVFVVRQAQDLDAGKSGAAAMTSADDAADPGTRPRATGPAMRVDTAHELLCNGNSGIDEITLNGTPVPLGDTLDDKLASAEFAPGEQQLWRILNAATDAFLDLQLVDAAGHALQMQVVGRDGSPLVDDAGRVHRAAPTPDSLAVPPSGRLEVLVSAPPAGTSARLVTHAVDTGCAGDRVPERPLVVARTAASSKAGAPSPPAREWPLERTAPDAYAGLLARPTDRVRTIAMAEYPRPGSEDQTDFYLFERRPDAVLVPWRMGMDPAITVHAGATEEWVLENWTNELHAFHIHQVHFRVLEIDGRKVPDPALLDVVEVPYATAAGYRSAEGPVRPGRVRVKVSFPPGLEGDIPFHCHLADHEDNGMMAVLRVLPVEAHDP